MVLITELVTSAARSIVLAGISAAGIAVFRVKNTSLRLLIWASVVYASLALPILGGLIPAWRIPVPEFAMHRIAEARVGGKRNPLPVALDSKVASKASRSEVNAFGHETRFPIPSRSAERRAAVPAPGAALRRALAPGMADRRRRRVPLYPVECRGISARRNRAGSAAFLLHRVSGLEE